MRRLVVVAGSGRSGTSTIAGALSRLGLYLPPPVLPPDETNPRGFYESRWVVDFHKGLLRRSPVVRTIDARPEALELAAARGDDLAVRVALEAWLGEQAAHEQVLVKDPRSIWFHALWRDAAADLGAETSFVSMLRHPAEVTASRDTHYTPAERGEGFRRRRATANVAGWCNTTLYAEQVTRGDRRVFVRYSELLADWRSALRPVVDRLGLQLDADLTSGAHHAVDDFVEPGLRRAGATWDSLDVPDTLRAVAEGVWVETNRLVEDPADAVAVAALGRLRADYDRLHDHAVGVALDHTGAREAHVRRATRANVTRELSERIDELEAQLTEANESETSERGWFRRSR